MAKAPPFISLYNDINRLSEEYGSVNLGQGFPDFDGPGMLGPAVERAVAEGKNQYQSSIGVGALRESIGRYSRDLRRVIYDPDTETLITPGCTGALVATLLALAEPGDEILTTDFYYDYYLGTAALAGATLVPIPFSDSPHGFLVDIDRFRSAVTSKTRFLLLNTPHNPTGKVFRREELKALAGLCHERDLLVISDEVYERFCYDQPHLSIADLPGMRERTIIVSSASKALSITGWRIGWAFAPRHLMNPMSSVQQHLNVSVAAPLQFAVASTLDWAVKDGYFETLVASYKRKRDILFAGLVDAALLPNLPEGGHFVLGCTDSWPQLTAAELCLWMTREIGVTPLTLGTYTRSPNNARRYLRFAFCKQEQTLNRAVSRLARCGVSFTQKKTTTV